MKKILAFAITLCLLLMPCAYAAQDYQTCTVTGMFSFPYPIDWYYYEADEGFFLYSQDSLYTYVSMDYVADWGGITLQDADEELLLSYKEDLDDYFSDYDGYFMTAVDSQDGITFLLYLADDADLGLIIEACTLINGWELYFQMFADGEMYDSDLTELYNMLSSFQLLSSPDDPIWEGEETEEAYDGFGTAI